MKKAVIVYHSATGTTKKFADEINNFCVKNNISTTLQSIDEFKQESLADAEYVFLGAWTQGLMILMQHPGTPWVEFTAGLPSLADRKIVLFTTYKVATGGMFKKMRRHINCKHLDIVAELKSRNGELTEKAVDQLNNVISQ